ncbi:AI-2E family transporter [Patescibacteria group bacterium]|nr:AI-2E family transporter [Patescibacteria group bacterium]
MAIDKQKVMFDVSLGAILKVVAVILALFFLYLVRDIVVIFIVALILATLISPLSDWFAKKRIPRALAVLLIYIVLIGVLSMVLTLLIPPLVEQSGQLIQKLSVYWDDMVSRVSALKDLAVTQGWVGDAQDGLKSLQAGLPKALSGIFSTLSGFFGGIVTFILILVLTFYMVVEGDALKKFFKSIAPERYQPHLVGLMTRAQHKIGLWLRGALTLGLIVGIFVYIGLTILGVKYALVLAILAGLLELIPYFGPPIAAVPAVFLAFSQAPIKGFLVLALYVIIQQLENNILVPKVMQKAVGLNPVVSILSLGIGFKLAGFLGAILAIPVATAVGVFVMDFIELRKRKI